MRFFGAFTLLVLPLFFFRKQYSEINLKDMAHLPLTLLTFCIGILVFVLWINMDWVLGSSPPQGSLASLLVSKKFPDH